LASAAELSAAAIAGEDLLAGKAPSKLLKNEAFLPGRNGRYALEPFDGQLRVASTHLFIAGAPLTSSIAPKMDLSLLPEVSVDMVTVGSHLVPHSRQPLGSFDNNPNSSYWSFLFQPGSTWREPADPPGWSRASFPVALVNQVEGGETHNGVALFMYKGNRVSPLRLQISQGTATFAVDRVFLAEAVAAMQVRPVAPEASVALTSRFEQELARRVPVRPWRELRAVIKSGQKFPESRFSGSGAVADAVLLNGTLYLSHCPTSLGELPYCDWQRFGMWSATKSGIGRLLLLYMAKRFGDQIYDYRIADLVEEAHTNPVWSEVTLGSAVNMATGIGEGSTDRSAKIPETYDVSYMDWYAASTLRDKIDLTIARPRKYPWGLNEVFRYRDQDPFILGIALQRLLSKETGSGAQLLDELQKDVLTPIGISELPVQTVPDSRQPLMESGLYATFDDLAKIATLYQADGKAGD
jgi:hypothetical protein